MKLRYGVRFGYERTTNDSTTSETLTPAIVVLVPSASTVRAKATGYFVGPAVGGEYFLADRFSIGGEVHLRYASFDDRTDYSQVPAVASSQQSSGSQSTIQTQASIIVREYLR